MMNRKTPPGKSPGRRKKYSKEACENLCKLWREMGHMCSKNMKAALPKWLPHYDSCDVTVKDEIKSMSASTIDRVLKPFRAQFERQGNTGTRPGHLRHMITVKNLDWKPDVPGHVEADTVAHCGGSLSGEFVWTLTCTDVYSGWTISRAVWNKESNGIVFAFREIKEQMPFEIFGYSVDNGSEFINHVVVKELTQNRGAVATPYLNRSRPYKKNDQAHIEQKNWTHVRELFGYARIDLKWAMELMNKVYREDWALLQNYFVPQHKLKSKVRVGAKYRRKYGDPMTPAERLLACDKIPDETKKEIERTLKSLNPFLLKQRIKNDLRTIRRILETSGKIDLMPKVS